MHLHLESAIHARSDSTISAMSWMGKVPDDMPEEEGWKLNRILYYQEGWLATATVRGIVGVTYTNSYCRKNTEVPLRTNYNLRGHRSEITMVKWNEPYQKLATCDSSGIIFVWIKYEGRWSIELINDRNTPVTYFCWSHDGRMALICYQDGFVLVGSVAGQRYWSSMLDLQSTITAGVFTPDDQQVYIGTTSGILVVIDIHGQMISQDNLLTDTSIVSLTWSCPKFKMEEVDEASPKEVTDDTRHLLAVMFQTGLVYLMESYDDVSPIVIRTDLKGTHVEWTNSGEMFTVAGHIPEEGCTTDGTSTCLVKNVIKFYTRAGTPRYTHYLPIAQYPISAMTWGHNDLRVFVATGPNITIGRVSTTVSSLQNLCRLAIQTQVIEEDRISKLPLPKSLRSPINALFTQTIRCFLPDSNELREFVCRPPSNHRRFHCTMIRHDDDLVPTPGACYTLYMEYLGGLVPLLKGKRTSKIRPEFVIFDPQPDEDEPEKDWGALRGVQVSGGSIGSQTLLINPRNHYSDSSDSEFEDICASPRLQRRRKLRRRIREKLENDNDELVYLDTLPERHKLVEVTSNIWGTKFKLHGVAPTLPSNLGQVTYKTSLLHLQPRQMTLVITELRDDIPPRPDPHFNPNVFSEDEEEYVEKHFRPTDLLTDVPPIAPMTPRRTPSCYSHQDLASPVPGPWNVPPGLRSATASSGTGVTDLEEHQYVDLTSPEMIRLREGLKTEVKERESGFSSDPSSNGDGPAKVVYSCTTFMNTPRSTVISYPARDSTTTNCPVKLSKKDRNVSLQHSSSSRFAPPSSCSSPHKGAFVNTTQHLSSTINGNNNKMSPHKSPKSSNSYRSPQNNKKNHESSSPAHSKWEPMQSCIGRNDVIKFIDDESGDSEGRSYTPSPSKTKPRNRTRARSKSVGHLIALDFIPTCNQVSLQRHQISSVEHFLAFGRSLSLKDCKKRQAVTAGDCFTMHEVGKSHSLDSSLLLLNCKSLTLTPNAKNTQITQTDSHQTNYIKTLHNSPSRIHVFKNPCHSTHIYENINVYATSFATSNYSNEVSPKKKKSSHRHITKKSSITSSPLKHKALTQVSQHQLIASTGNAIAGGSFSSIEVPSGQYSPHHCNGSVHQGQTTSQSSPSRTFENRFFRGLKEAVLGEKLISLQRDSLNSHPQPPPTPKHVASPDVSRKNANLAAASNTPSISPTHSSRSSPPTPSNSRKSRRDQSSSPIRRHLLNSPLLSRRRQRRGTVESSDDEFVNCSSDAEPLLCSSSNYRDLETFQKNQLKNKLRRTRAREGGSPGPNPYSIGLNGLSDSPGPSSAPRHRQFLMHNKTPLWNEQSQVYQLDFGGRVTQESAKNFQIEFKGNQVMQFGRIDGNAYTLDFQYPFSAIQAFSVALANVTQRLK